MTPEREADKFEYGLDKPLLNIMPADTRYLDVLMDASAFIGRIIALQTSGKQDMVESAAQELAQRINKGTIHHTVLNRLVETATSKISDEADDNLRRGIKIDEQVMTVAKRALEIYDELGKLKR